MTLGQVGIWRRRQEGTGAVAEIEALGFTALWVGGSPSLAEVRPFLEESSTLTVATGILNVWQHDPADVAAQRAELARAFPGRFLLGIGVGHPEATAEYTSPLQRMRAFFDGLDAAPEPVPRDARVGAALGPKMLELAAQRSLGTHTYFVTVEHTRFAREHVGPMRSSHRSSRSSSRPTPRRRAALPASTPRSTWAGATTRTTSCASGSPSAT
jgi:probable F420-dependent oxidoreductase